MQEASEPEKLRYLRSALVSAFRISSSVEKQTSRMIILFLESMMKAFSDKKTFLQHTIVDCIWMLDIECEGSEKSADRQALAFLAKEILVIFEIYSW